MDIKQKASRARALLGDLVLREAIDGLRADQIAIFTGRAPDEVLIEARHMVWALDALEARLQSFSDDEAVFDRRQSKVAPQ
ncbi:MAG: hypothetical protein RLZ51_1849 [Pseudomonadota bacterium]|jgi:hypothetical protein